jgi:Ca2+-binding RTX toxin-like protein
MQVRVSSVVNVNSTVAGNQDHAAVAATPTGGFTTAFVFRPSGSSQDVLVRSLTQAGGFVSNDFSGSSVTTSNQYDVDVAVLQNGKIATIFTDDSSAGRILETDVAVRLSNANGTAGATNIVLNDKIGKGASEAAIAALSDGGFAAAWVAYRDGGEGFAIAARSYDAAGNPLTDDFIVANESASTGDNPDIAALPDGRFIVTWDAPDGGTDIPGTRDIKARIFARDGTPLTDEFTVNSTTLYSQDAPRIAVLADGRFAIVWISQDVNQSDPLRPNGHVEVDYRMRVFNSDGTPVGDDVAVTDINVGNLLPASIAEIGTGNLVVAWSNSEDGGEPQQDIAAVVVDTAGTKIVDKFIIGASADPDYAPDLARLSDGRTAVVWHRWEGTLAAPNHEVKSAILSLAPDNVNPPQGQDWTGSSAANRWQGSAFNDRAQGKAGNDVLFGYGGDDILLGGDGRDYIYGGLGNDGILGGTGNDTIYGGDGDDRIAGGLGQDILFGGAGADRFTLHSLAEAGDIIRDYDSRDTIALNSTMFRGIADGAIDASIFVRRGSTNAALDSKDRFIFQTNTDTLWYDADGTGQKAPVLLFDFATDVYFTASDILIV